MEEELNYKGNRYTLAISIYFPFYILATPIATVMVRKLGPRIFLPAITLSFGLIVIGLGLSNSWKDQVGLRIILGLFEGCYFPSATFLISMYYLRQEVAKRMAVFYILGLVVGGFGGLIAYGLKQMDGTNGLTGWRWIFIWEGIVTIVIAIAGFFSLVDFPEDAHRNYRFLQPAELEIVMERVRRDRADADITPFRLKEYLAHGLDWRLWAFSLNFFSTALITYSVQYFLPIILETTLGFSNTYALCLTAPVYACAGVVSLALAWLSDYLRLRGPILIFNGLLQIIGFVLIGWTHQPYVRYFGTYLVLAGTASNSPLCVSYQANNVVGQWRRAFSSASIVAFGTIGGVVAPFGFRAQDAPEYRPGLAMCFVGVAIGIVSVCVTSVYMYWQNRKQAQGRAVLENTPGFRYTL
ncbi:major facilitator superfamily domain-containing protein [Aspergillus ambiguus]|uniref:major facilitator superfamily domain-containing protein n=1 Tax=Aspergillus ambiguus TaxID=176160 RepID=UPI003CCCDA56